jgi:hypothetical protein
MLYLLMDKYSKYLKNRNYQIGAAVVAVILVLGVGLFLLKSSNNNSASNPVNSVPTPSPEVINTLNPSDLGITLTAGPSNQTAVLAISDTKELTSLDYELSYMANVNGSQVARGAIGHIDIKSKGTPVKQSITLGTCSDVCHYDTGVTDIKLTLKIVKTDNKTYQSNLTLSL